MLLSERVAERVLAGLRQSGSHARQHAAALESGDRTARLRPGDRQSLQRPAGLRRLRQCRPPRSGRRGLGSAKKSCKMKRRICRAAPRSILRGQVATMQSSFFRLGLGHDLRGGAGLPADGREFPILAGSVHHPDGAARRDGRHSVDAVRHPDHLQRAVADGRHHVHRRGHREQHSDGDVRQR